MGSGPPVFEAARHAVWRVAAGFLAAGGVAAGVSIGLMVWAVTLGGEPKREAS
jgi:hypothetical protein